MNLSDTFVILCGNFFLNTKDHKGIHKVAQRENQINE
jgi:hypothetical protein